MKITPKQFALSLYEVIIEKTEPEARQIIKRFVKLLADNNQLNRVEKIIAEFIKIWQSRHGAVEALATSANGLNKADLKLLKEYIIGLSGAKEVLIKEKVDKNILGGVIIQFGDKIFDGSLKTQLVELKNRLVK